MNLPRETKAFIVWLARIMRQFLRVRPGTTLAVVGASATAKITRLLAFFLPLKVILLGASDGVPRYFPFIDPAEKLDWIIGLAIAAFIAYGLTLLLDALSSRFSRDASAEVLQGANEMTVLNRQDRVAENAYTTSCEVMAGGLFVGVGALVLLVLDPTLLVVLAAIIVAESLFSARIMAGDDIQPGRVKAWVMDNTGDYLKILASINFFSGFLVILAPFLLGAQGNILIALLSILLLRRAMNTLADMGKDAVSLHRDQHKINPLVFRNAQLERAREDKHKRALQVLFNKPLRQQQSVHLLQRATDLYGEPDVRWVDSNIPGANTLIIAEPGPDGRFFQQQIFLPNNAHQLENEDFLFRHIPRAQLNAPDVVARFNKGPFVCQICDYGTGQAPNSEVWPALEWELLVNIWCNRPPKTLVRAYQASHPLLHQRLSDTLIERLSVAVDYASEQQCLDNLLAAMPVIRARLRALPLVVHNPDLNRINTITANGSAKAMTWSRWSLEPLGWGGLTRRYYDRLMESLSKLRAYRSDIPSSLRADELKLVGLCEQLESQAVRYRYKAGLQTAKSILKNPIIAEVTTAA